MVERDVIDDVLHYTQMCMELLAEKTASEDQTDEFVEDKKEIRKIILENTKFGETFWLSEIVSKFNLDLKATDDVLEELVREGSIREGQ